METPATSFSLFPKLPTEVRCIIWEFMLPGPRVVYLDLMMRNGRSWNGNMWKRAMANVCGWKSQSDSPLLRRICCESVQVLKNNNYTAAFRNKNGTWFTWFNFKIDTLYLSSVVQSFYPWSIPDMVDAMQTCYGLAEADFNRVERLALDRHLTRHAPQLYSLMDGFRHLRRHLKRFASLQNVTISFSDRPKSLSSLKVIPLAKRAKSLGEFIGCQPEGGELVEIVDLLWNQVMGLPRDFDVDKVQKVWDNTTIVPELDIPAPPFKIDFGFVVDEGTAEQFTTLEEAHELHLAPDREKTFVGIFAS